MLFHFLYGTYLPYTWKNPEDKTLLKNGPFGVFWPEFAGDFFLSSEQLIFETPFGLAKIRIWSYTSQIVIFLVVYRASKLTSMIFYKNLIKLKVKMLEFVYFLNFHACIGVAKLKLRWIRCDAGVRRTSPGVAAGFGGGCGTGAVSYLLFLKKSMSVAETALKESLTPFPRNSLRNLSSILLKTMSQFSWLIPISNIRYCLVL